MERKVFLKYIAVSLSDTGFQVLDGFSKRRENRPEGSWVKAISLEDLATLPRLIFLKGYWVFLTSGGEKGFKALCPWDHSILQYQLPAGHLFCIRCSRTYSPLTGECMNLDGSGVETGKKNLKPLPVKLKEEGVYIYLE